MHAKQRFNLRVAVLLCFFVSYGNVISAAEKEATAENKSAAPRKRRFQFDYGAKVSKLPPDSKVRVWWPVPQTSEHQKVSEIPGKLPPKTTVATEPKYGNRIRYFHTQAPESGEIEFQVSYRIERREVRGLKSKAKLLEPDPREKFLSANTKVPLGGKPLQLLNGLALPVAPLDLGRTLYNRVDDHMRYDKSKPGYGNGDAVWACDSRFGNCTDFHSLFISLARGQGLPARFEIGFSLPNERGKGTVGGYHCWASFFVKGHGWVPTDISEADKHPKLKEYYFGNLTENRVAFTVGRDLQLIPKQAGGPLNYFVYPYVEVDDKPWPQEKIEQRFGYKDIEK